MKKYQTYIPYSMGAAKPQAIAKQSVNTPLAVRDFFLHLMFARLAINDDTTYEFDTKFNPRTQEIDLRIAQKFIGAIEDISIGPKMRQFLDWLIDRDGILSDAVHVYPFVEVDEDYTIEPGDSIILADATNGPIDVTLPPTDIGANALYRIKRLNAGANLVRVVSQDDGLIDGIAGWSLDEQYTYFTIFGTGSQWVIV